MEPVDQAQSWSERFEGADPPDVIRWAIGQFGPELAVGSSFGRDGLVVLDITRRIMPGVPVLFLETGFHFPETLAFRDELVRTWGLNVVDVRPALSVSEQEARWGPDLFARDPDSCCRLRKVGPLQHALLGYSAWISGLRRDQHPNRAATPVVEWQDVEAGHGVYKLNPMVSWSRSDVDAYLRDHGTPSHPLWARGYASVGCAPCTAPVEPGAPERSGRWAASGKVECGIHVMGIRRSSPERVA